MKHLVLFFSFFCIGIMIAILYVKLQTPLSPLKGNATNTKNFDTFSLEKPPTQSLAGSIETMSGEVRWQSRVATEAALLSTLREIQQGEGIVTGEDGNAIISFPSNITITLQANTQVDFIQTLPVNLVMSQPKGKVTYQNDSKSPVSIRTFHLLTNQKVGRMHVFVDEDKEIVTVNIINGTTTIAYNDTNNISNVATINKGETLTFDDTTRTARITP